MSNLHLLIKSELNPCNKTEKESTSCENRSIRRLIMPGKRSKVHHSKEKKLIAVIMCLEEGKTHAETADEVGLPRSGLIEQTVRRFRWEGAAGFDKPNVRPLTKPFSRKDYSAKLGLENPPIKKSHRLADIHYRDVDKMGLLSLINSLNPSTFRETVSGCSNSFTKKLKIKRDTYNNVS